jgi:hypothetical protein
MGAFPVFVVDGEPSPLKSQARAARFFRGSGMDLAALSSTESSAATAPVKGRNAAFTRSVEECVVSSCTLVVLCSFVQSIFNPLGEFLARLTAPEFELQL